MKYLHLLWLLVIIPVAACRNTSPRKMEKKELFSWQVSVTAPKEYPVEIHKGYLATNDTFITGIYTTGIENQGWQAMGTNAGNGKDIPAVLSLIWVSYAEKKFWAIDTKLPADSILSCLQRGFTITDRRGVTSHTTYNHITIGLAPGGIVVLWLNGERHQTEIGRFQAKETFVDVNDFYNNPQNHTQQAFYDTLFKISVPAEAQDVIKSRGIPLGLWDTYRDHYNWRFHIQFYKDDTEIKQHRIYLNGEEETLSGDELTQFRSKPLPWRSDLKFTQKWAETEFNDEELIAVFHTLTSKNKEEPVEIVGKVGFMYNDITFSVKTKVREIALKNVKVHMWNKAN